MNKSFNIIKLKFTTPLHISVGKDDYDHSEQIIHSDTLKSAIFVSVLNLYGDSIANKEFLDSFTISSAFPFYKEEYFFPKPMVKLPFSIESGEEAKVNKALKKMQYFGLSYFEKLINFQSKFEKDSIPISKNHFIANGEYVTDSLDLIANGNKFEIVESNIHQRVFIPRETGQDSKPYYVDRLYFTENSGLFFIIDSANEETYYRILSGIKLLADTGIGTDKNVGNGLFEFEEKTIELNIPETANKQMALSLYCPIKEEIEQNITKSSYSLVKRGGYIASPQNQEHSTIRKKSVYMFTEGSVFPANIKLTGKLLDLKPELPGAMEKVEHPIWRDGRAIFINLNASE